MPVPHARREDLVEDLHGHLVADPYRWLERGVGDPEVEAFVTAQAAHADGVLRDLPARGPFRDRLEQLWRHPRSSAPWRRGSWWFRLFQDAQQDQQVLQVAPVVDPTSAPDPDAWRTLVDPNTWSEDGTASLSGLAVTDDGARIAFARSDAGSDWMTWRVAETEDGTLHDDELRWARFSGAAWLPDGSSLLYGGYPAPEAGAEHEAPASAQLLKRHRLGSDQAQDTIVYERPDDPQLLFQPAVSHDGRWLVLTIARGTHPVTQIHLAPIEDGEIGSVSPLLDAEDARYTPIGLLRDGTREELIVLTDRAAPNGRVIAIDPTDADHPRELVAERDERLLDAHLVGAAGTDDPGWLVVHTLHHATSRLRVVDVRTGRHRHDIALPGLGTVEQITGGRRDTTAFLTVATFTSPTAVHRHDLTTGRDVADCDASVPLRPIDPVAIVPVTGADADPTGPGEGADPGPDGRAATAADATGDPTAGDDDPVVVRQVLVHHDGVAVPLFLVHRRSVTPDGSVPTVLWGYGGFDISVTPMHRPGWRAWVEAGGLLAVACLRGGGEYGRAWHDDGRLANKQHVFDDALACAAWLTGRDRDRVSASVRVAGDTAPDGTGAATDAAPDDELAQAVWTAPHHLGIEGRSNGGLLVGACMTQAPEAFGTAVPEVGVLDLTRFHRFTIGWAWISDYGDPEDVADLEVLLRYSPYHNLEEGRSYPATLVTTGDTDDRVVPLHSFKFAAALQHAQGGTAPVLLRVDIAAGHGAGKPTAKLLDERADVLAFHAAHLGLEVS
ncbi:MAG: S9 family peptidase [Nitriliruptoraceae bacterium]|nr:S9 family peptidase [Nitriliruptoraceae bacterium]